MIALAKGMLSSKPVCRLRPEQCEYLAELAVYAFRRSRGQGRDDLVNVLRYRIPQGFMKKPHLWRVRFLHAENHKFR